jgi:molecular chaperone DnaK
LRDPIIGIDLGTSNTVVAHVDSTGKPVVLADDNNYKIHPSVVSFHPNGGVVVGAAAKQRKVIDPQNTIYSVKRLIGRSFRSAEVKTAMDRSPFLIKEGEGGAPTIVTRAGEFAVPEISAIVLDYVRNIAAERLSSVSVNRAVVTVPASFNDAQRSATATAGSIANLQVMRVLNEPTAAALAYGHTKHLNQIIAVYDFGGGTFDITILKLADQVYEVLGTAGDTFLGGDDLDERIVDKMVAKFLAENRLDLRTNEVGMMRLRAVAEQTKIELSRRSRAVVRIDEIAYGPKGKPLNLNIEITRDEFVSQVSDIIDRTFPVCQEALALAGLGIDQIHDVILVGGTSKIPYVRDQVSRFFAKAPRTDVNPEDAVAIGASLQAHALERASPSQFAGPFFDPADEPTHQQPQVVSQTDDDTSGATVVPSELATGAPRMKRPTATFGTPVNKPDTSYSVSRTGTKEVVGKNAPPPLPPAAPLGRMTKQITGEQAAVAHKSAEGRTRSGAEGEAQANEAAAKSTAKGFPVQRTTAPVMMTQQLPITQQPPAPPASQRSTQRSATPPPVPVVPQKTTRIAVPQRPPATIPPLVAPPPAPRQPLQTPLTSETAPSFSGEIETTPGTLSSTAPDLVLPNPAGVTFESLSDLSESGVDSYTDADATVPPSKSFIDTDSFTDFETAEKRMPSAPPAAPPRMAPLAPPPRTVPVAPPNARTMIAPPPAAHPFAASVPASARRDHEFDDDPPPASTAKGLPPMPTPVIPPPVLPSALPTQVGPPAGLAPLGRAPSAHEGMQPMPRPPQPGAVPIMPDGGSPYAAELVPAPVVLEVTPRGLGIGTVAGFCEELIRRNSRLPAAQKKLFSTSRDKQDLVRIVICQGESRRMDNNTVIGDLVLDNLPPRPRGETSIEVTFHLDASGILQVRARDAETGVEQSASLDLVGGMASQDVAASRDRIASLRR